MAVNLPADYMPSRMESAWVRTTGRSWWQAAYTDGHVLNERSTMNMTTLDPKSTRWEETKREGMRGLLLYCPNGQVLRLTSKEDHKLFEFKIGINFASSIPDQVLAQVIGVVVDSDGRCVCLAWEPKQRQIVYDPLKRADCLVHAPSPHDGDGRYRRLDFKGADGVPVQSAKFKGVLLNADGSCYCGKWANTPGRAVKFEDNVFDFQYHELGPLGLENLRLKF